MEERVRDLALFNLGIDSKLHPADCGTHSMLLNDLVRKQQQ